MDISETRKQIFKTATVGERARWLHEKAIDVMSDMYAYCSGELLDFMVTETVTTEKEDKALGRVSKTHFERRAFDLSVRGWDQDQIDKFVAHFNFKYSDIAAIPGSTGIPTLVVYEPPKKIKIIFDGKEVWIDRAAHLHVQINARYAFRLDS